MKIQALHLYNFMEYASIRGVEEAAILSVVKNPPADYRDELAMVEADDFYAVVALVQDALGDELLGIRLGEFMQLKALGLVYRISLQTTTVEEALFYLKSYLGASFPLIQVETAVAGALVTITIQINNELQRENRIILENTLTVMSRELRMMYGSQLAIQRFSPLYGAGYPNGWQLGESFALVFTHSILKATLHDKSRWNLDVLVPEYLKLIEGLKSDSSFTSKVKITMLSMAMPALPDLEGVADALNMTARTLQRRLSREGTSFRNISADLKKEISHLLIGHGRFTIADISDVLGFSEPASFIHTFKRWYGSSPDKFRMQHFSSQ